MGYTINGFHDFYTVLSNERKIGGAIEAEKIVLRTGEVYHSPVFTNIDYCGSTFYSICFLTDKGKRIIVNVNDVSAINSPTHKKVADVHNQYYKVMKITEKIAYLKRLFRADQGAYTKPFLDEAKQIVEDIGIESIEKDQDLSSELLFKVQDKVIKIA